MLVQVLIIRRHPNVVLFVLSFITRERESNKAMKEKDEEKKKNAVLLVFLSRFLTSSSS